VASRNPKRAAEYLVGMDFSAPARQALKWAQRVAAVSGAKVEVLHVLAPVEQVEGIDAADYLRERRQWAERQLHRLAGSGVAVKLSVGDPASELISEARRRRAQLLVLGASHRSTLQRWLLGSVVSKVLPEAPCAVVVVPARQRAREG